MNRARLLFGRLAAAAARTVLRRLRRAGPRITVITSEAPLPWPDVAEPWPSGKASPPPRAEAGEDHHHGIGMVLKTHSKGGTNGCLLYD